MRFRLFKIFSTIISILFGVGCLVVALFAYQLGLDNNPTPGTLRKILAGIGVLFLIAPLVIFALDQLEKRFHLCGAIRNKIQKWSFFKNYFALEDPFVDQPQTASASWIKKLFIGNAVFWCTLGVAVVITCSVWYMTTGMMTYFRPYSNYYDLQADGFLAGQTSLAVTPPEELAKLANPYDWKARTGIHFIWDASYYQGKYYFYWGPVPALLAALVKIIKPGVVEDQHLLLFFISGLSIVFACLLYYLRKKYFPAAPAWLLFFFILVAGLSTPVFWLVNRPNVYETAIASCQFFLFLGLYAAIRGFDSASNKGKWLLLSGFGLGAAVGSRVIVVFAVFFIVGIILLDVFRNKISLKKKFVSAVCLFVPLIIFAGGLIWFNYARYGSPFETGLRYQLTGDALPEDMSQLYSIRYIIPNAYLSLLQPFQFTPREFPFIVSKYDNSWTRIIHLPESYYFSEQINGILYTIPFLWLLVLPAAHLVKKGWRWVKQAPSGQVSPMTNAVPARLWWMLAGSVFISFVTSLLFVFTTMRYLADFTPMLVAALAIYLMDMLERARFSKVGRFLLLIALILLCLASVVISLLINFSCGDRRIQNDNPLLYEKIAQFFQ